MKYRESSRRPANDHTFAMNNSRRRRRYLIDKNLIYRRYARMHTALRKTPTYRVCRNWEKNLHGLKLHKLLLRLDRETSQIRLKYANTRVSSRDKAHVARIKVTRLFCSFENMHTSRNWFNYFSKSTTPLFNSEQTFLRLKSRNWRHVWGGRSSTAINWSELTQNAFRSRIVRNGFRVIFTLNRFLMTYVAVDYFAHVRIRPRQIATYIRRICVSVSKCSSEECVNDATRSMRVGALASSVCQIKLRENTDRACEADYYWLEREKRATRDWQTNRELYHSTFSNVHRVRLSRWISRAPKHGDN